MVLVSLISLQQFSLLKQSFIIFYEYWMNHNLLKICYQTNIKIKLKSKGFSQLDIVAAVFSAKAKLHNFQCILDEAYFAENLLSNQYKNKIKMHKVPRFMPNLQFTLKILSPMKNHLAYIVSTFHRKAFKYFWELIIFWLSWAGWVIL